MEKNKPLELALDLLQHNNAVRNTEFRFIHPDFGIVISFANMESYLFRTGQPYRVKEGRIIHVLRGEARISVNLIEYTVKLHTAVIIPSGSLIELLSLSPDYDFQVIAFNTGFLPVSQVESLSDAYQKQGIIIRLTDNEWQQTGIYFTQLWDAVQQQPFRREVAQHLLSALLFNLRYIQKQNQDSPSFQPSRQEELFRRFIALVNEYSKSERNVGFYAGKLCLTPRYLNTVIRQASGQTVMEWINQSVVLEAKVLLKHSDLLVYQVSDALHFQNPSFFCKFFKRMTGMTPQEYQKTV